MAGTFINSQSQLKSRTPSNHARQLSKLMGYYRGPAEFSLSVTGRVLILIPMFFVKIFGKPVSKCIALFQLHCFYQSKSKFRQFAKVLLAFLRKTNALLLVFHQELPFICLLHESAPFSRNFVKDTARSLLLISFNPNKYFIIYVSAK